MSYRSFKHLLGETSLERKCRFLFGLGILVLVTVSFFLYGQQTERLVIKQTDQTALLLVNDALKNEHYKALGNSKFEGNINALWAELNPATNDLPYHHSKVLSADSTKEPGKQPVDDFERAALSRFLNSASAGTAASRSGGSRNSSPDFRRWPARLGARCHWQERQEGVSIHPGGPVQTGMSDGLSCR